MLQLSYKIKLFHPDFPNLDFHTFIHQLLVQQKKRSEYRYDDYHQPGPSSLSTLHETVNLAVFFYSWPVRNLAAAFVGRKQLLEHQKLYIFIFTWNNRRYASISITFISVTTTLGHRIRMINSDKAIDQPNVTIISKVV